MCPLASGRFLGGFLPLGSDGIGTQGALTLPRDLIPFFD